MTTTEVRPNQIMKLARNAFPVHLERIGFSQLTAPVSVKDDARFICNALLDACRAKRECVIRRVKPGIVELWQR